MPRAFSGAYEDHLVNKIPSTDYHGLSLLSKGFFYPAPFSASGYWPSAIAYKELPLPIGPTSGVYEPALGVKNLHLPLVVRGILWSIGATLAVRHLPRPLTARFLPWAMRRPGMGRTTAA